MTVGTADKCVLISEGSGTYNYDSEGTLTLNIRYKFTSPSDGKEYAVTEELIRRQDPLQDLRFEEWTASSGSGKTDYFIEYQSDDQITADGCYAEYDYGNKIGWLYFPTNEIPANLFKSKALSFGELKLVGIKSIGNYAFGNPDGNASLKNTINKIEFTEGLETIGNNVFENINTVGLDLVIPNSVISIGEKAFRNSGVTSLKLGDTEVVGNTPEENSTPNLKTLGSKCFNGCANLGGDIVLPSSVASISDAFYAPFKNSVNIYIMSTTGSGSISDTDFHVDATDINIYVPNGQSDNYTVWHNLDNVDVSEWGTGASN